MDTIGSNNASNANNQSRPTRLGDFPSNPLKSSGEESRSTQGSAYGQSLGNGGSTWQQNGGIWGNSTLGSTDFGAAKSGMERLNGNYLASGSGALNNTSNSNSLLGSTQADAWSNRQRGPWNDPQSDVTVAPGIRSHGLDNGAPSSRNLSTNSIPAEDLRSTSPYFAATRQAIVPNTLTTNGIAKKGMLDPTSGSFVAGVSHGDGLRSFGKPSDSRGQFPFNSAENGQFRTPTNMPSEDDRIERRARKEYPTSDLLTPGSSSASRSSSIPPHRSGLPSPGIQFGTQISNPAQGLYTPQAIGGQRAVHSASNSVYSTHSQLGRQDSPPRDAATPQMMNAFGLLSLDSTNQTVAPVNISRQWNSAMDHRQAPTSTKHSFGALASSTAPGVGVLTPEGLLEDFSSDPFSLQRHPRSAGQGSASPADSDHRASLRNSYYSASGTPPTNINQLRAPPQGAFTGRGQTHAAQLAQADALMLERKLKGIQQGQQGLQGQPSYFFPQANALMMRNEAFRGNFPPHTYDYSPGNGLRLNQYGGVFYPSGPAANIPTGPMPPRGPARDQEIGHHLVSPLLQEFRSNTKTSKRYDLKDLYNHVVEFSGDQHGSRFIQQKLENANSDDKDQVFREIRPNALQLTTDVFGNYVIQKFFEHGNQHQKSILAEQMKGHILSLSLQMYGCRVVQKALEHILLDQQVEFVKELESHVMKCIKDQNGNHVIQKAIERVPQEHIQFVVKAVAGQVPALAVHQYGCRVIQRLLEHCDEPTQSSILQELHASTYALVLDPYGNYVVQHITQNGKEEDRAKISKVVAANFIAFSKNKCGSNVVERCMRSANAEQLRELTAAVMNPASDHSAVQGLMKDQYANYVIQSMLQILKGEDLENFKQMIKPQIQTLRKFSYGKQITAIEKIINTMTPAQSVTPSRENSTTTTPPLLSTEAQSPQSSSYPSTTNSTIDGPSSGQTSTKISENPPANVAIAAPS